MHCQQKYKIDGSATIGGPESWSSGAERCLEVQLGHQCNQIDYKRKFAFQHEMLELKGWMGMAEGYGNSECSLEVQLGLATDWFQRIIKDICFSIRKLCV